MRARLFAVAAPLVALAAGCTVVTADLCGDRVCDVSESCSTCPTDCGACGLVCGNQVCESGETCTSCPSDCGTCGRPLINLYWNVNGTVDGTATGDSWDTCAEVGAATVVVSLDGVEKSFDCYAGGNMSAAVEVAEGNHTLTAKLTNASGQAITTTTVAATVSATAAKAGEFIADFFWDSFLQLKNTQTGDYWFATSFEGGKSCAQTNPPATLETSLLKLSGSAVTAQVCGPTSVCYPTNGTATGPCWGPTDKQKIKDVLWGDYKLRLQGIVGTPPGDVCWETQPQEIDILVGAGTANPLVQHDIPRFSSQGACTPY